MADKYDVFTDTKSSWNNLGDTADVSSWVNAWGVDAGEFEVETVDTSALTEAGKNILAFGSSAVDTLAADLASIGNPRAIGETADAAASAAIGFLQKKLDKIKTAWETPTEVTVKALIDEIAPYAVGDFKSAVPKIGDVVKNVTNELLGTDEDSWTDIISEFGEQAVSYIATDSNFTDAVSNLGSVKLFADTMQTISESMEAIEEVLDILEPLSPLLEIGYEIVASWCTGGSSAVDAGNKASIQVEDVIAMLMSVACKCIRKYVYNIKIKVPSLLVNVYQSSGLSIKDYVDASWDALQSKFGMSDGDRKILEGMFSDEYYQEQFASPDWKKQINKLTDKINKAANIPGWATDSSSKWSRYMSKTVSGVLNAAVKKARKASYIPDYDKVIWSDPTTWFTNSKVAWTRTYNYTENYWEALVSGDLSSYVEETNIFDSEDNPIKSAMDIVSVSKILLGSDTYKQWIEETEDEEKEED